MRSLRTQLLVVFLVVALVPFAVSLLRAGQERREAEGRAWAGAEANARVAADEVAEKVRHARGAAAVVERLPAFWDGDDETRDRILAAFAADEPTFSSIVYFTADLNAHGASNHRPGTERLSVASRDYAREAVASGREVIATEALIGLGSGQPILPMAMPVQEGGPRGRSGYLAVMLRVSEMPTVWSTLTLPEGSRLALVDTRSGRVLVGSGAAAAKPNDPAAPDLLAAVTRGDRTAQLVHRADGIARLLSWAPVVGTPWVVSVAVPRDAVTAPIEAQARWRAAEALGTIVLCLLLLVGIWLRLQSKLAILHRAAERWSKGEWEHRPPLPAGGELAKLASAYGAMADRLAARECEREQQVRLEGVQLAARTGAHEVNNRLVIAMGYAELLDADRTLTSEQRDRAKKVLDAVGSAAEVMHKLQRVERVRETHWGPKAGTTIDLSESAARDPADWEIR